MSCCPTEGRQVVMRVLCYVANLEGSIQSNPLMNLRATTHSITFHFTLEIYSIMAMISFNLLK